MATSRSPSTPTEINIGDIVTLKVTATKKDGSKVENAGALRYLAIPDGTGGWQVLNGEATDECTLDFMPDRKFRAIKAGEGRVAARFYDENGGMIEAMSQIVTVYSNEAKPINDDMVSFKDAPLELVYDRAEKTPEVTVIDGAKELEIGKHYTVEYINNINASTDVTDASLKPTVRVIGVGRYSSVVSKTFEIAKYPSLAFASISS